MNLISTYYDSISTFKSNAIKALGNIFEIESLADYPNLAIELESLAGCDPEADEDCNLKCILKILLSQITKGKGFDRFPIG